MIFICLEIDFQHPDRYIGQCELNASLLEKPGVCISILRRLILFPMPLMTHGVIKFKEITIQNTLFIVCFVQSYFPFISICTIIMSPSSCIFPTGYYK